MYLILLLIVVTGSEPVITTAGHLTLMSGWHSVLINQIRLVQEMPLFSGYCQHACRRKFKGKWSKKNKLDRKGGTERERTGGEASWDSRWDPTRAASAEETMTETQRWNSSNQNPLLHQRQTKQNHLNSSFVPTEPCRLGSRRCRRRDRLQGNNPSFSTQQKSSITLQSKAPGFICLEDAARERERERDSGGENSNILKYARETKKVHGRGSGLQKSNQKLNWVARQIDIQI